MARDRDFGTILGALGGQQLPGGCDDCAAYQTVEKAAEGLWILTVHHDDGCPVLRRMGRSWR